MSDETSQGEGGKPDSTPPAFTQDDVNRMIADRLSRQKESIEREFGEKFGDYDALKDKATKFDEIDERSKTELQKLTERAEKAERLIAERDEADRKAKAEAELREKLAKEAADIVKGSKVPATALRGNTREELQAHFAELNALIPEEQPRKGVFGPYVPPEGKTPPALNSTALEDALRRAVGIN